MAPPLFGLSKELFALVIPMTGYAIGHYWDYREVSRMTRFRDKSSLYGGNIKPGDPPSWPRITLT